MDHPFRLSELHLEQTAELLGIDNRLKNFNYAELGEGGFGPVYKGILSDGREVAVKKLSNISPREESVCGRDFHHFCSSASQPSEIADVFGFGVVALEILCGRPNADSSLEPERMLDVYIYDYLLKRNLHNLAKAFMKEGKVVADPVAIDAPGGFLFEWWSVFWDIFISRTNEKHSENAAAYIEMDPYRLVDTVVVCSWCGGGAGTGTWCDCVLAGGCSVVYVRECVQVVACECVQVVVCEYVQVLVCECGAVWCGVIAAGWSVC
ncbi:hypothetical protein IFM89_038008 [Coptis chinensis]|uniref:Uncharacterized protein n=1 Tax=Coptis chinensis TaxID=261450 RepID=A0A835I7M9_9MAGN|nr:hypothetical protein IFM89_038008 [Coptis chinensis]